MHAQANLFHPWHQHWAERICCQQLSLLAQTLAPLGEGETQPPVTDKEKENARHCISSFYREAKLYFCPTENAPKNFSILFDLIPKAMRQIKGGTVHKNLWSTNNISTT